MPGVCEGCLYKEGSKKNKCRYNKSMMRRKLTKVGKSRIAGAGLGLFAGEFI